MNLPLFFFFLSFLRSTGWCRALGSSEGACPEETCFSSNRETCNFGSSECGNCFQGFLEVGKACIAESSPNDDSWESEIEGNDDSDLTEIFDTTITPTEKPRKTEKQHQHSPVSTPHFSDFTTPSAPATAVEENSNELNNKDNDLGGKVAAKGAESSDHRQADETKKPGHENIKSSDDLKSKSLKTREQENKQKKEQDRNEEIQRLREKHKKLDEAKLNKFLSKKQQDGDKLKEKDISSEDGVNLESNSSTNPPPFIIKHKVGKSEGAKASEMDDIYFLFIVIGCSVAGIAGLGLAGYCWYKLHTTAKAVSESEYASYGMKGTTKRPPSLHGDDKLDYNAEMYHYHQTKSQLTAMEKAGSKSSKQGSMEDEENSDEGDEGDYTVYECPGLAPTGDMTVVNPLFSDQEAVGSDQDANGNRSGHSSPTSSRHSSTNKPAE